MAAYTYTTLRYVHDTTTGEFVNLGVALSCPEKNYVGAQMKSSLSRVTKLFPEVSKSELRQTLKVIQEGFDELNTQQNEQLVFNKFNALELAKKILPSDDSSLQWSPIGGGTTEKPEQALTTLHKRMVERYDDFNQNSSRHDDAIWKEFTKVLNDRSIVDRLSKKVIEGEADKFEFKHAWKNGLWNCYEAISLDMKNYDNILTKARQIVGHLHTVKHATEKFKVFLLIGAPTDEKLKPAYDKALRILKETPREIETEIHQEKDFRNLSLKLEEQIKSHDAVLH